MNVDDLMHFTLKEWTRMSIDPTTAEVERAKSQTKAAQLLVLDGTNAIADDVSHVVLARSLTFSRLVDRWSRSASDTRQRRLRDT
jgi:processing peptidase subunit beta